MKLFGILAITVCAVMLLGCAQQAPQRTQQQQPAEPAQPMVGNDRDAHGCIPSAGYSWCEVKQKCLRTWEEPCEASTGGQVQVNNVPPAEPPEAETPPAAPVASGDLEVGVAGLPVGTAGWANYVGLQEMRKKFPNARLMRIDCQLQDIKTACVDSEGTLTSGAWWLAEYTTQNGEVSNLGESVKGDYAIEIRSDGSAKVFEREGTAFYVFTGWKADYNSDAVMKKALALKPGTPFGVVGYIVGSKGPHAMVQIPLGQGFKGVGISVKDGSTTIELGFK